MIVLAYLIILWVVKNSTRFSNSAIIVESKNTIKKPNHLDSACLQGQFDNNQR